MLYYVYYVCMFIHRNVYNIYHCVCRFNYQLIVVGGDYVGVSIWHQEELAIGVDGEETQEVRTLRSDKVSYGLGFGLRLRFGPTVDV